MIGTVNPFMSYADSDEFTPASITPIGGWWDPSDAATITKNGSNEVAQLADKSGNGNHATQATDANKPLDSGDTKNGLRVLQYNRAGSNSVQLTLPLGLIRNLPGATFTAVLRRSTTSSRHAFGIESSGFNYWWMGEQTSAWVTGGRRLESDSYIEFSGGDTTTANWHIVTWLVDWQNTLAQIYANGTLVAENTSYHASGNSEDADANYAALGGNPDATGSWRDQYGESCLHQKALDATERSDLWTYLSDKWGITI